MRGGSNYEGAWDALRQYSPYQRLDGFGAPVTSDMSQPYDLNTPGSVAEIKRALYELAKRGADPLQNPTDPVTETVWKELEWTGPYADAWTGQASDELVTALSRYAQASEIPGPYIQLGGSNLGKYGIVGGAQPTAAGLEVLAGAVEQRLGGQPIMQKYLEWRGGTFAPPSTVSGPPSDAVVVTSHKHGPFWDPAGYTPAYDKAPAELLAAVAKLDDALVSCLQQQVSLNNETQRQVGINDCLRSVRASRHQVVLEANKAAPAPECPDQQYYDPAQGRCVAYTGIVDLPPPDYLDCINAYMTIEGKTKAEATEICYHNVEGLTFSKTMVRPAKIAIAVGAALGLGFYYVSTRRRRG